MLYIIATPIGNLEDISLRALRILKEADYVLAEDTRRTGKLLSHYKCMNKLISYNDKNKERKTPSIMQDLQHKDVALVSDAGTPGISDPGFYLVRECVRNNIQVSPIPGPNAAIAGLVASGLPTDRFAFYGFLPKSKKKKQGIFKEIQQRGETAICYESPYRIKKTIKLLKEEVPDAQIVIAREITKKFEEFIRGTAQEIYEKTKGRTLKGEITLFISNK